MNGTGSSHITPRQRRHPGILFSAVLGLFLSMASSANALMIDFNFGALTINDNGLGDLNPLIGILDFNTVVGNYSLIGRLDLLAGPNQVSLIGSPNANLRLTNFTAEALIASAGVMDIDFSHFFPGTFNGIIAADSLDAYVGHATAAAVPVAQDSILQWQGYVSGQITTLPVPGPPPYTNPFLPASSVPLPYPLVTHGPTPIASPLTNPAVGAYFSFDLRGAGDQLILYTSAEVGFTAVPEASSFVLAGAAGLALIMARGKRMRKNAR
ncbi:MAG: hypothetical protein U1D30_00515 [Planctomycetota bacterium]